MKATKPRRTFRWNRRNLFWVHVLIIKVMIMDSRAAVVPVCPPPGNNASTGGLESSFCQCNLETVMSGTQVSISCTFSNQEDVELTEDLYPFQKRNLVQARVLVRNATSVRVTEGFLRSLQSAPSAVLDVWRGGQLIFDSSPQVQRNFVDVFNTYLGVGIIRCNVPSLPKRLFRDRKVVGLLIKGSRVDKISREILYNINKVKYIKITDSQVGIVDGPISNGVSIPLLPRADDSDDKWQGFEISNSTIAHIAPGSFSFKNEEDSETTWKMTNSQLNHVETGAITATGNLDVTFRGNSFGMMHRYALMVNATGDTVFEENVVDRLEPDGLKMFLCGSKNISMTKNTVHMESPHDQPYNSSTMPFHPSCGKVQVFVVMSPPQPQTLQKTSNATWVLLAIIILIVSLVTAVGVFIYRNKAYLREYRRGETPYTIGLERTTMQELRDNNEPETEEEDVEETGLTNPVYGIKEPS
ncbi:uncharacterized protein LOC135202213 [Macrobrachium nipponense]|uniref:uncharacterized protein LOC135202213 n=1 Tax=Macrobrachium nipponense TaxID=159736 RepID=UPI0030C8CB78